MKKILVIISLLFCVVALNAQFATLQTLLPSQTTKIVTPVAGDTIHGSDAASTAHYYTFKVTKDKPYYYAFVIKLDSTLTHHRVLADHVWVQLLGSISNPTGNDGWVALGSPVKYGASIDSTFSISDVATGVGWPYLKVRFSGITANKCSTLKVLSMIILPK